MKFRHTSKLISLLMVAVIVVAMMITAVMPISATTNTSITEAANSLLHIRMVYRHDNKEYPIQGGSCFLINSTTILTCEHVIAIDSEAEEAMNRIEGGKYRASNVLYQVMVQKDISVYATLKKYSTQDDYAILTLNDSINKPILKLADTSNVEPTQQVYALGFPAEVSEIQYTNTYTSEDVTVTDGLVQKKTEYMGTDVIQHGATLTSGNSGGPLVDANGNVIGINKGAAVDTETGDKDYFYAVNIDQVRSVLEALFIDYTLATDSVTPEPEPETKDEPETQEYTYVPPVTQNNNSGDDIDVPGGKVDTTKIIIIVAIALLVLILIAVVVIILVNSTKKPKAPAPAPAPVPRPAPPVPPYVAPPTPPVHYQGATPTMPSNDGAGETSVLNEGAGETTVLGGGQATGFVLVKIKGGERVNINKPEFTIGKERRRVDYCIADNNSISRVHAKLRVRGGRCYITDLGSTNCTYVNGTKLSPNQEVILSNGDKIKFSDEEFEFVG